jgi:peptidoglycan hydrolase-like protein with peptidoglycan-binding domain
VATDELAQRLFDSGAPEFVLYTQLKKGSEGVRVEKLQTRLRDLGYLAEPMDGEYGSRTVDAIKLFQKKANLKIDGVAGEENLAAHGSSCGQVAAKLRGGTR